MTLSRAEQRRTYDVDWHLAVLDEDVDQIIRVQEAQVAEAHDAAIRQRWIIGLLASLNVAVLAVVVGALMAAR